MNGESTVWTGWSNEEKKHQKKGRAAKRDQWGRETTGGWSWAVGSTPRLKGLIVYQTSTRLRRTGSGNCRFVPILRSREAVLLGTKWSSGGNKSGLKTWKLDDWLFRRVEKGRK
jgi:hypothetical protein